MQYIINIVTVTKKNDSYDMVAVNKYPIVSVGDRELNELFDDEQFILTVKESLKTKYLYDNSKLYVRTFNDDMELVSEEEIVLPEKINISYD